MADKIIAAIYFSKAIFRALSSFCTDISLYRIQTWISGWERDTVGELVNLVWLNKILNQRMLHYGNKPQSPQQHHNLLTLTP